MPKYYVQKFTYDGPGESVCYGAEDAHNHSVASQFTVDVKQYLVSKGCKNIVPGPFLSSQPKPSGSGKEFRWDAKKKKWVKI